MMLSVFERTREVGLLRAVGMRRGQVRTMVRSESVVISVFGGILGIVMGAGLGVALVASLRQEGVSDMAVPVLELVFFLVLSGAPGPRRGQLACPSGGQARRTGRHRHRIMT
jgi:putative ABC transport system permease protein